MTDQALIEAVTREVLAVLTSGDPCADCHGSCAAHSPEKVRSVVANGADRVSYNGHGSDVPMDLARYIDHTLLKPDATAEDIDRLCTEALEYGFASVCVNPTWVKRAAENVRGSEVKVASVIGFPFGATPAAIKAMEARRAIRDGAREIDMVINIGALKSREHDRGSQQSHHRNLTADG
jgi:deoxyribose-phosphate aldolase